VYFLYLALRLRKSVVTLAVTGNTTFGLVFTSSEDAGVSGASIAVDRKSMGHTVADRSSNEADFLCIFYIWRSG
jgi:glutamine phosphoribosylpyrophosphate amidotransferase